MCKTNPPYAFLQNCLNDPGAFVEQFPGGLLLCQRQTSSGQPETDTAECTEPRPEGKRILKTQPATKTETMNKTSKGAISDLPAVRRHLYLTSVYH